MELARLIYESRYFIRVSIPSCPRRIEKARLLTTTTTMTLASRYRLQSCSSVWPFRATRLTIGIAVHRESRWTIIRYSRDNEMVGATRGTCAPWPAKIHQTRLADSRPRILVKFQRGEDSVYFCTAVYNPDCRSRLRAKDRNKEISSARETGYASRASYLAESHERSPVIYRNPLSRRYLSNLGTYGIAVAHLSLREKSTGCKICTFRETWAKKARKERTTSNFNIEHDFMI